MERFLPSIMQNAPSDVTGRLELFRTQTLATPEPADKKDAAAAEMNSYMDMLGLESFQVPPIDTINTRAGLYICINAAVSLESGTPTGACSSIANK